ncbi:MAG: DNA polymerase III subunit chi [Betaproteobacteria bacterium CG2_30_59_46]|nr:MAG: DNA polymerase III subunit chi [Betaproteobacteria bacterium CG2_30_59_46]PIQ11147.1 MAG: DNA polymerase III subunit chi [Hydrogenophilales bacterium CG18_big_fil_WC_8_21_14_2_50_58_12]PIY01156.1 MAG: DNA polymerase III subunit chi [Hydrogenophilales bacterium CG_4_10_14_3_um_filter_58_23]PJB05817.1 MAG: DNA polymerase III subunit chi [Hydrogenophilales bacterium CG_4_9_14_3_um_filter_59_35]
MTQIDFYTHTADKYHTACVLCAKAVERGLRVMVYTPDAATTEKMDKLLWSTPAVGFIPHCRTSNSLAPVTPVIVDHNTDTLVHDDILLNLHTEQPLFFSRFHRLIEIVGTEENDAVAARKRFRFYQDRGYEIKTHDIGNKAR